MPGRFMLGRLMLAYFGYRHGLPLTFRSALYPLIGNRIYGPIGDAADVFAVTGTVFGMATSLGFGVLQIDSGLTYLFGFEPTTTTQLAMIIGISSIAALSAASGINAASSCCPKRISSSRSCFCSLFSHSGRLRRSSNTSLKYRHLSLRDCLEDLHALRVRAAKHRVARWLDAAVLGWWISWSPFVGMFIAQISRGRTIREFLAGVLLIPAGFTLFWMTASGIPPSTSS